MTSIPEYIVGWSDPRKEPCWVIYTRDPFLVGKVENYNSKIRLVCFPETLTKTCPHDKLYKVAERLMHSEEAKHIFELQGGLPPSWEVTLHSEDRGILPPQFLFCRNSHNDFKAIFAYDAIHPAWIIERKNNPILADLQWAVEPPLYESPQEGESILHAALDWRQGFLELESEQIY